MRGDAGCAAGRRNRRGKAALHGGLAARAEAAGSWSPCGCCACAVRSASTASLHSLSRGSSAALSSVPRPRTHVTVPVVTSPNRLSFPRPSRPVTERTPRARRLPSELRAVPAAASGRRQRASRPPPSFPPLLVTCSRACAVPSPGTCPHHVTERAGSTASPALSFEAKISRIGKKIKKLKIKKVPQPHTSTAPINPRCRPALQAPQSRFTSVSWILMFFSPFLPSFRPQGHLRSTHCFPPSSYSCLEIHICWNVPWGELGAF